MEEVQGALETCTSKHTGKEEGYLVQTAESRSQGRLFGGSNIQVEARQMSEQ